MMTLDDQQLGFLEQEITARGIHRPELGAQLLDHIACGIEREMTGGLGFHEAYHKVYMEVCPGGLEEVEQAIDIVDIHLKYGFMKKTVFAIGFASAFASSVGFMFKSQSWPWANNLILIGSIAFTFAFLPMYFWLKYRSEKELGKEKPVLGYVLNLLLVMIICFALPYKQFHGPASNAVFLGAQLLLILVFFPKVFLGWYRSFSARNQMPA